MHDETRPKPGSALWLTAGALVGAGVFSARLAVANPLFLIAGIAAWRAWRRGELAGRPVARPLLGPIALFCGVTIVGVPFSLDPLVSVGLLPRLLVLLVIPLAAAVIDITWWRRLVAGLAAMTVILAGWGVLQYLQDPDDLEQRISGPLSNYMTYAGWLLVAVMILLAELLLSPRRRIWFLLPAVLLGSAALALSFTRNAWVGLLVGLLLLAAVWRRRLLLVYPILVLLLWVVIPRAVLQRALSTFDLQYHANYDRVCMLISGVQIVRDHPWTGVGLDMVKRIYPRYRRDDAPRWRTPHLHNNPLQIAAERGLVALAAYVWLLGAFFTRAWRALPRLNGPPRAAVAACFVAIAASTVAGMFEYNFWDAEVQFISVILLGVAMGRAEEAVP